MLKYIGADELVAQAKMIRAKYILRAILLVEGDTDYKFISKYVAKDKCELIVARGKWNAIGAVNRIEEDEPDVIGVLAIVDADHDRLSNSTEASSSIVYYDYHDLEIMLIESRAFHDLLGEIGSPGKLDKLKEKTGSGSLKDHVYYEASKVGSLRFLNHQNSWGLNFNGTSLVDSLDLKTAVVDIDEYIRRLLAASRQSETDDATLKSRYLESRYASYLDRRELCCGHDVVELLGIALRRLAGSLQSKEASPEKMQMLLRMAHDTACLLETELWDSIAKWESQNSDFHFIDDRVRAQAA